VNFCFLMAAGDPAGQPRARCRLETAHGRLLATLFGTEHALAGGTQRVLWRAHLPGPVQDIVTTTLGGRTLIDPDCLLSVHRVSADWRDHGVQPWAPGRVHTNEVIPFHAIGSQAYRHAH
jgi:hypothetical protein